MLSPPHDSFLVDMVTVVPPRDDVDLDGTPIRNDAEVIAEGTPFACAVQTAGQSGMVADFTRRPEFYREEGEAPINIVFAERPNVGGAEWSLFWTQHGRTGVDPVVQTFDPPIVLISVAAEIPPGGGRARWTVTAKQRSF